MFERELAYFIKHQDALAARFQGKVLVIRGEEVFGAYDSALEAYLLAQEKFPAGTYMIQPCEPGRGAYTVTVNSSLIPAQA